MSPERVKLRLNEIRPNDFPDRNSWERVLGKFPKLDPALLDLDLITDSGGDQAVVITRGNEYGYCARDGNHTLARILQLFGENVEVYFTENTELREWHAPGEFQNDVDWRVKIVAEWGVGSFTEFLKKCLEGKFYRSEAKERIAMW